MGEFADDKLYSVEKTSESTFKVTSYPPDGAASGTAVTAYEVKLEGGDYRCSCPGFEHSKHCRHIVKVNKFRLPGGKASYAQAVSIVTWVSALLKPFVMSIACDELVKDADGAIVKIVMSGMTNDRTHTEKRMTTFKNGILVEVVLR